MTTELILVRHGETAWNLARRLQGHIDIPLNPTGLAQAQAAGRRLADERIDALYASDLARARQTAEAIGAACGLPVRAEPRLRERFYGDFEGRDHAWLERELAEAYARWRSREPHFELPGGGESLAAFQARIARVLEELAAAHAGQRVVLVTHGGVLDCAYRVASGLALEAPRSFELLNASVNRLARTADGRWSVRAWADVEHLAQALDDVEPMAP